MRAPTAIGALLPHEIEMLPQVPGPAHARVLFRAAHNRLADGIAREFRRLLAGHSASLAYRAARVERTDRDTGGNVKLNVRLEDGAAVETVILSDRPPGTGTPRRTLCVSSQVGCAMGCTFCRTGRLGFRRNLRRAEIVAQYQLARERFGEISNVVFMGMGEPLLNAREVFAAASVFAHPEGPEIPFKRITVSTCGIPAGIEELATARFLDSFGDARPRLAVSLVTADPDLRARLMPGATRLAADGGAGKAAGGPAATGDEATGDVVAGGAAARRALDRLRTALEHYLAATGRPVTMEVPLLGGVNDSAEDAGTLCAFLDTLPRRNRLDVNLIPWNPVAGVPYAAPTPEAVSAFAARVLAGGYPVTGRYPRGRSIAAACGQLGEPSADQR